MALDIAEWLQNIHELRVLHCFNHAWNFIDQDERIISVVTPGVGRGPFHIVIPVDVLPEVDLWQRVLCEPNNLFIGEPPLSINLKSARRWDASLCWNIEVVPDVLIDVCEMVLRKSPQGLAKLYFNLDTEEHTFESLALEHVMMQGQQIIQAIRQSDKQLLAASVEKIAGQGIGLTPSGDDWLLGCIAALHYFRNQGLARQITGFAVERTTQLSGTWLNMATQGKFGEPWHRLSKGRSRSDIETAAYHILRQGHSSGADALVGFIQTLDGLVQ